MTFLRSQNGVPKVLLNKQKRMRDAAKQGNQSKHASDAMQITVELQYSSGETAAIVVSEDDIMEAGVVKYRGAYFLYKGEGSTRFRSGRFIETKMSDLGE